jgi:cytochrome c556
MIGSKTEEAMVKFTIAALAIAASAGVALAAVTGAEAIKERRALMKADGAVTKAVFQMLQGRTPFDLALVQKALKTYQNAASKEPALFPPDSKTGDTNALPVIWDDDNLADLDARFKKLGSDATAALVAIKDEASFKATMPDVLKNCDGCHEKYHAKQQ